MPIFLFTVKDPHHKDWRGFSPGQIKKIVVRADSRKEARQTAKGAVPWESPMEGAFGATRMKEQPDPHPLENLLITDCEEVKPDGPNEVIAVDTTPDLPEPEA